MPRRADGPQRHQVAKLCGADVELGNFVEGRSPAEGRWGIARTTCGEASRRLLAEIRGVSGERRYHGVYDPQDRGRKYLSENGGCVYIDLDHLELCIPEVESAADYVAAWHAMLRVGQGALTRAAAAMPEGMRLHAMVNNSDGEGNSYGSHLSALVTRRTWSNVFQRKLHYLAFLAAYQASSVVFTGQGKVGSENRAPEVDYQLTQRADFLETLVGEQTTYHRPIVNSRNEALCGGSEGLARMHVIFYDNTLSHVATYLKVGVLQIVLAMIEAEAVNPDLALDDPVSAVRRWSHDPSLRARAALVSGRRVSALELQRLFLEEARRFVGDGKCDEIVPDAHEILARWEKILDELEAGDLVVLARSLDWALKRLILERTMDRHPSLGWSSPEIKRLDQTYGSLDRSEGLFWAYEAAGFTERIVSDEEIERRVAEPPCGTRAWTRSRLLRLVTEDAGVSSMDWDHIVFRMATASGASVYRRVELADPTRSSRADTEAAINGGATLSTVLDRLGAATVDAPVSSVGYYWDEYARWGDYKSN